MRKSFAVMAIVFFGLMAGSQAQAASICDSVSGNVVTNCGFESGSFSGWTLSGNMEGGVNGDFFGVDGNNPNSGNYEAYLGVQGGGGTNLGQLGPFLTLSQTLSTLPGMYYEISFYLDQAGCSPGPDCGPGYTNYFDVKWDGVTVFGQQDIPSSGGAYDEYVFVVGSNNCCGQFGNDTLSFDSQNDPGYFYLDDVTVSSLGPTPEPATLWLVAPILGGLFLLARRRRKTA
jgi:hypothetical protein